MLIIVDPFGRDSADSGKNEVPVPDALKGKEITILCRAVDSAYSTLLAPGQVIATLVAWKLPGIGMNWEGGYPLVMSK